MKNDFFAFKVRVISFKRIKFLAATVSLCMSAQAAQPAKPVAEQSLSKVCATAVPDAIERATSHYLLPITAMGGNAKPLCGLWQEFKPDDDKSRAFWEGVAGAVLLHATANQSNIAPYRALIGKAIVSNPAHVSRRLKTADLAMESIYAHVRDNALLSRGWTPRDLATHLQSRAPDVAATLQKAYDKWDTDNDATQ